MTQEQPTYLAEDETAAHTFSVRINYQIYVYHSVDGKHIETIHVAIPDAWWTRWPTDATVRRYIHNRVDLRGKRIDTLDA
jgi:hypothetical protein